MISARLTGLVASAGSAGTLLGAFGFQYIGGLAPCAICLWQRWPHAAATLLGVFLLFSAGPRIIYALGAVAAATTGGFGVYHTGVERGWWEGPSSCTSTGDSLSNLSGSDLLSFDTAPPLVMCDEVAWQIFGLSMASVNAIASFAFAALWIVALRRA